MVESYHSRGRDLMGRELGGGELGRSTLFLYVSLDYFPCYDKHELLL